MSHFRGTDKNGFRFRGGENTRIEAFTDAAFAFSLTLLMIGGGHVPANVAELLDALKQVPGYAASFALLCLFWYAHYLWYRRYGLEDGRSILLSLLLVFLVLIYIFPLHMMFNAAIYVGSTASEMTPSSRTTQDWRTMYMVFGIAYASMCVVVLLLYVHALQKRDRLELDAAEVVITRASVSRWTTHIAIALISVALAALVLPSPEPWLAALPGFAYWLTFFSNTWLRRRLRRKLAALAAASA